MWVDSGTDSGTGKNEATLLQGSSRSGLNGHLVGSSLTPHEEEKGSGYNTTSRFTLEGRNQMT